MKITVDYIRNARKEHRKISMLTCYDYSFARILDQTAVDILLIGDSLGTVIKGEGTTENVTVDEIVYHCKAVRRGAQRALVVADLPLETFKGTERENLETIVRIHTETGVDAVKIEGAGTMCPLIKKVIEEGIPVMGHIGLTPQTASSLGGFKVQGKDKASAERILKAAHDLEACGVFSVVMECVIADVAAVISKKIAVPTIGIGAGKGCDGQVLVLYDMLVLFTDKKLKFARRYAEGSDMIATAANQFVQDIRTDRFPDMNESFTVPSLDFLKQL